MQQKYPKYKEMRKLEDMFIQSVNLLEDTKQLSKMLTKRVGNPTRFIGGMKTSKRSERC